MKKTLLLFFLFIINGIFAQTLNQPTQYNTVCDDNNDGFAAFFMGEISYEIIGNAQNIMVTHHLTQADAANGVNPLPSVYTNISNPQLIFARVVNNTTNAVQIITYNLTVNPLPSAILITLSPCDNNNDGFEAFDLSNLPNLVANGQTNVNITVHETLMDAEFGLNSIPLNTLYTNVNPVQQVLYTRVLNSVTGCFSIGNVQLIVEQCQNANCPAPSNVQVSNITNTSAVLSWNSASQQQTIEIYFNGTLLSSGAITSPYTLTGLQCGQYNSIALKSICANNEVSVLSEVYFETPLCPQAGSPESFFACIDLGGQACFNLTDNDDNLMGTLDPTQHIITYHASNYDATYNLNPLSSPYCVGVGNTIAFARITNTNGSGYQTSIFSLIITNYTNSQGFLQSMSQCDNNNDNIVIFDLTSIQAQINTTNSLLFYNNQANAEDGLNQILNPTSFSVSLPSNTTTIFVREIVSNGCDIIHQFQLIASSVCNLAANCIQANSLCNALGLPFVNSINTNVTENGANYGCLGTHPNPTWFYLPVSQGGTINLMVQQNNNINFTGANQDVDYIVYGPFTSPTTPCYSQLTQNNIISCSYSAASIEYPVIPNTAPGQYYLIMLTNFSNQPGFIRINEIGSSTGQINCSGMKLNAFLDTNNNGTQETNEVNFPLGQFHYEVNDNGVVHDITSPVGMYNIYETNISNSYDFSFSIIPSYASMYAISTSSYSNVSITNGAGMITYNFPVTVVQPYNDLAITIIPFNDPRPGFVYQNKIVYGNLGNQTIASGTVTFEKDSAVTITSISQSGTTANATGFTYNFTNLLPFEYRTIDVYMQVPTIPTVNAGDYLDNSASIVPLTGDVVVENNESELSQMVVNAYDPNDKVESRGAEILHSTFTSEDYLYYTIRFENTGNASAINVRVNDVLNSQLDASSVRMISASHPYVLDQVDNNLTWNFDNIQLPVSVANTNIGKGYITFKVKPMPGYAVGDIIPNAASIYFDFNPAIVTNTFNTEFTAPLSTEDFINSEFVIFPNPSNGNFMISLKNRENTLSEIKIYDVLGKNIFSKIGLNSSEENISISDIKTGIYIVEIQTVDKIKISKKLVIK